MVKLKYAFNRIMSFIPLFDCRSKIEISISLLCFAFLISAVRGDTKDSIICIVAMSISLIGDILMNFTPVETRSHKLLYSGAAFFMVAHLVYAYAYITLIKVNHYSYASNVGFVCAVALILGIVIMLLIFVTFSESDLIVENTMLIVFGVYIIFISINFVSICSYSWSAKALSFLGALSFLLSDLIIGIENLFKIKNDNLRKLVWVFYPLGQILIIACR